MLLNTKPVIKKHIKSTSSVRQRSFKIINHAFFDRFIFVCIVLHTLVMTIEWYLMKPYVTEIVTILNFIFASIYTLEAVLKIIA